MSKPRNEGALVGLRLGSCVLERPLGVGGAGAVYLARQERPRRQVAVKVLHPRFTPDPSVWSVFLARFRREADATAGLDHANIVPIYEFGEQDEMAYLVMPYLADGSLADLLADVGPLPLERAAACVAQTAAALDCAHAHGIIHRDVKPSNLLLHPDGRLLLADFGIAYPLGVAERTVPGGVVSHFDPRDLDKGDDADLTHAGMLVGTPHYMAPEQIRGGQVSAATDVYALGILAYTLLAGEPPFTGTTVEVLRQQLTQAPATLAEVRPDVSPRVEEAITWALSKRPSDRPVTAGDFAQVLIAGSAEPTPDARAGRSAVTGTLPLPHATDRHRAHAAALLGMGRGTSRVDHSTGIGYSMSHWAPFADDAPTLYDAGRANVSGVLDSSVPPTWPIVTIHAEDHASSRSRASRLWRLLALAIVAVIVLGLALLGPGLLINVVAWQSSLSGGQVSGAMNPLAIATATVTAVPSPTPVANWLAVEPATVSLGCSSGTKSVQVILQNLGPEGTSWSADVPFLGGVSLSPSSGEVPAGGSVALNLSNTSYFSSHKGTIIFTASSSAAGQPALLSYVTRACRK